MGYRCNVGNAAYFQSGRVERTQSRIPTGPWPTDLHFNRSHPHILRTSCTVLRSHLSSERRTFTRTLEIHFSRCRPTKHIALSIGYCHDRIIERRMNMCDSLADCALDSGLTLSALSSCHLDLPPTCELVCAVPYGFWHLSMFSAPSQEALAYGVIPDNTPDPSTA